MSFAQMKANRQAGYSKLVQDLEKSSKGSGFQKDERLYYPERDKEGNGFATIRFLPAPADNATAFVKTFSHGWRDKGGWFIEECPTTVGKGCPVCEENSKLWQSGIEDNKKIASMRKRKTAYFANILVVKDAKNPENEGKVFLFQFGQKIFDKIQGAAKPLEGSGDEPINVFDMWEGANFRLKIKKVSGNTNYDDSLFEGKSSIQGSDDDLEAIWNKEYDLRPYIDKDSPKFKSETELKNRFARVTGAEASGKRADNQKEDEPAPSRSVERTESAPSDSGGSSGDVDTSDPISFFASLGADSSD